MEPWLPQPNEHSQCYQSIRDSMTKNIRDRISSKGERSARGKSGAPAHVLPQSFFPQIPDAKKRMCSSPAQHHPRRLASSSRASPSSI
eukprot:1835067-Amphidinium_carterae.1